MQDTATLNSSGPLSSAGVVSTSQMLSKSHSLRQEGSRQFHKAACSRCDSNRCCRLSRAVSAYLQALNAAETGHERASALKNLGAAYHALAQLQRSVQDRLDLEVEGVKHYLQALQEGVTHKPRHWRSSCLNALLALLDEFAVAAVDAALHPQFSPERMTWNLQRISNCLLMGNATAAVRAAWALKNSAALLDRGARLLEGSSGIPEGRRFPLACCLLSEAEVETRSAQHMAAASGRAELQRAASDLIVTVLKHHALCQTLQAGEICTADTSAAAVETGNESL